MHTTAPLFTRLSQTAQLIVAAIEDGDVSAPAIMRVTDVSEGAVRKQINKLQKRGVIARISRGRYRVLPTSYWQV